MAWSSYLLELTKGLITAVAGWPSLGIIFLYSFLIAFILPLPSGFVLLAPLEVGLSETYKLALIVTVSGLGKAAGSLVALGLGQKARRTNTFERWVENLLQRFNMDVIKWSENESRELVYKYGYFGLAGVLSIPFFPDTAPIYAFSLLDLDYGKFAASVFAGSVIRLVIVITILQGTAM